MSNFYEKVNSVCECVTAERPDLHAFVVTKTRNGGSVSVGISIHPDGSTDGISPVFYCDKFHDCSVEETAKEILKLYDDLGSPADNIGFDVKKFNKSFVMQSVFLRVYGIKDNAEFLEDKVYFVKHDLAFVATVLYSVRGDDTATFCVREDFLDSLGIEEEELLSKAVENSLSIGLNCISLSRVVKESFPGFVCEREDASLWVVCDDLKLRGTVALLNHPVLEKLSEKLDSDLAILPSSIYEVLCVPVASLEDSKSLLSIVCCVNKDCVCDTDKLTDSVYYYSREKQAIELACSAE